MEFFSDTSETKTRMNQISPTFYLQLFSQFPFAKKIQTHIVRTEKMSRTLLYEKVAYKMWVKLTLGDSTD